MLITDEQKRKADDLLALHHGPELLLLPNAWDVSSAAVFAHEHFSAIGTTSAGIAATLGYADGEEMTLEDNLAVVSRVANFTTLPVSADMELGYANTVEGVAQTAREVLRAGAVGLNIEDRGCGSESSLAEVSFQTDKIKSMRELANSLDIRLVINARTDVFLVGDDRRQNLDQAIERGNAYREAGADCVFVPDTGNLDEEAIRVLVNEVDAPINVIAGESTPAIARLQEIGVSRVSVGPRPMRALLSLLREIGKELKTSGTYEMMSASSFSYSDVNSWFRQS